MKKIYRWISDSLDAHYGWAGVFKPSRVLVPLTVEHQALPSFEKYVVYVFGVRVCLWNKQKR